MPVSPKMGIAAIAIVIAKLPRRSFQNRLQTSFADWTYFTCASFCSLNWNPAAGKTLRLIVRFYTGIKLNKG
jgi:hypothetical protein